MMMRSFSFAIFALTLVSILDQTEGLASIVRSVRRNTIWGRIIGRQTQQQLASFPEVKVVVDSHPFPQVKKQNDGGFDADAYRQAMTDLVYERNMQRLAQ